MVEMFPARLLSLHSLIRRTMLPILLVASPGMVFAEEKVPSGATDSVTPQFVAILPTYIDTDTDRGTDEGLGIHINYGRALNPRWYWETDVYNGVLETGDDAVTDYYQFGVSTGLSWAMFDRDPSHWTPYALGMVGAIYDDAQPDRRDGTNLTLALGAGVVTKSLFDNGIRLRAEVRYLYDEYAGDQSDLHWSAGIEIPLRGARIVERVVYVDRVKEVEREVPVMVTVHDPDSDMDGVPDSRDRCPDTLRGARVDATGCIIESQTIALSNVAFELGSDRLTPSSREALIDIAASLRSQSELRVEVAGHTDSQGGEAYNMDLSQRRAESVRNFLIGRGVAAEQLTAKGYGPHQPVADNATASGRAMNRRVEFRISK